MFTGNPVHPNCSVGKRPDRRLRRTSCSFIRNFEDGKFHGSSKQQACISQKPKKNTDLRIAEKSDSLGGRLTDREAAARMLLRAASSRPKPLKALLVRTAL
jgi:hypothetical protein